MNQKDKEGFLCISLGTLVTSLLENILAGEGVIRAGHEVTRGG